MMWKVFMQDDVLSKQTADGFWKCVPCFSDEDCPDESVSVLHTGLHEFAFSFNLPQM